VIGLPSIVFTGLPGGKIKREGKGRLQWHRHSRVDASQGTTRINAEQNAILRDTQRELINSLLWSRQRTRCRCCAKFFLFDEESQEHVRIHTKILATCYLRFTPKREKERGRRGRVDSVSIDVYLRAIDSDWNDDFPKSNRSLNVQCQLSFIRSIVSVVPFQENVPSCPCQSLRVST